jgi:4-hydroxy-tetrahydrodipicolinate reductase
VYKKIFRSKKDRVRIFAEWTKAEWTMNIAILGFGKMGQQIAALMKKGQALKLIIDPGKVKGPKGVPVFKDINSTPKKILNSIDVFIEFTEPAQAKKNILSIIKAKKGAKIVSGTTGWNVKDVEKNVKRTGALLLHSANFSLGINTIASVLPVISKTLNKGKGFNTSMTEYHHKHKKDAPSGTAKMLAGIMAKNKTKCPITSVREGTHPGTHIISFDSGYETIEIKHEVRNRDVFCVGTLIGAEWIKGQKKPGSYEFSDVVR